MWGYRSGIASLSNFQSATLAKVIGQGALTTAPRRHFGKGHKTSEEAGLGRGWYYIPPTDHSLDHLSEEDKIIACFESTKEMLGISGSAIDNFLEMTISSPSSDIPHLQSGGADPDADLDKTFGDFKKEDMIKLLKEASFMPQHLDERYLWDRGDLPIEPLVTPEQYRAVIRARSDDSAPVVAEGELTSGAASAQEENDGKESYLETLRGGEKDWAFFTSEVIDYYNQFLKGESFAGRPGLELVKIEYKGKPLERELGKSTTSQLEDRRTELRTEISPENLFVVESSDSTEEEEPNKLTQHFEALPVGNVAGDQDTKIDLKVNKVSAEENQEYRTKMNAMLADIRKSIASSPSRRPFRYQKDLDQVTFDTQLTKHQAAWLLEYIYQQDLREQRKKASIENLPDEEKSDDDIVDAADSDEFEWLEKYQYGEFGDHLLQENDPDDVVEHYFHDAVNTLPDEILEKYFGPKNTILQPRLFVKEVQEFRRKLSKELGSLTRVIPDEDSVPFVLLEMTQKFEDDIPEERRVQFANFKQMLYSWTQYTELRSQQHGANEQLLLAHREKLMKTFQDIRTGSLEYRPETEHMDPMFDSRGIDNRMRVAIPVAHTKAVLAMAEMAEAHEVDAYENRGRHMQELTDVSITADPDAPYIIHLKDTAREWDEKIERADKRLDNVKKNDWAFTTSSASSEEDTLFSGNFNEIGGENYVRKEIENSTTSEDTDDPFFENLHALATAKEEHHGKTFHAHEEAMQMSEESWMVFMGRLTLDSRFSIGKTLGKGPDFMGYEDLSFDPADRWYTDEEGNHNVIRNAEDQPTQRQWDDEDDIRHELPDYPSEMSESVRQAYFRGYFDPPKESTGETTTGASSLGYTLTPEDEEIAENLDLYVQNEQGSAAERNRHRLHLFDTEGKKSTAAREIVNDRKDALQDFIRSERDAQLEKNKAELMPMETESSNRKYFELIKRNKVIREMNPMLLEIAMNEEKLFEGMDDKENESGASDDADADAKADEAVSESEEDSEGEVSDVSDMLSSEPEYEDASDQEGSDTTTDEAKKEGGSDADSSTDHDGSKELLRGPQPTRGEGADPYFSVWKDYTSDEPNEATQGATNPLPEGGAVNPQEYIDRDDFAAGREPAEWNSFNYTDPVQSAFFQEFNPHDFQVPQAERYVYDSKNAHDRPWRLSEAVKSKMYELHLYNPTKWHPRSLAALFKISTKRADAILKLQALQEQYKKEDYPLFTVEDSAVERIWPSADAVWDHPYVPVLNTAPPVRFADEVEVVSDIERIRKRQDRLRSLSEQLSEVERDYHTDLGAYGAKVPRSIQPEPLDDTIFHPNRYTWVMTDISDIANNNFAISVRDADGILREPNAAEYDIIRKKEKRQQDEFFYVKYRQHVPPRGKFPRLYHGTKKGSFKFVAPPPITHSRALSRKARTIKNRAQKSEGAASRPSASI